MCRYRQNHCMLPFPRLQRGYASPQPIENPPPPGAGWLPPTPPLPTPPAQVTSAPSPPSAAYAMFCQTVVDSNGAGYPLFAPQSFRRDLHMKTCTAPTPMVEWCSELGMKPVGFPSQVYCMKRFIAIKSVSDTKSSSAAGTKCWPPPDLTPIPPTTPLWYAEPWLAKPAGLTDDDGDDSGDSDDEEEEDGGVPVKPDCIIRMSDPDRLSPSSDDSTFTSSPIDRESICATSYSSVRRNCSNKPMGRHLTGHNIVLKQFVVWGRCKPSITVLEFPN